MPTIEPDTRSPERRALDEQIAQEAMLTRLDLPPDAVAAPLEVHLAKIHAPIAVSGVVENGVVRPLDPNVRLRERARVIIVAAE